MPARQALSLNTTGIGLKERNGFFFSQSQLLPFFLKPFLPPKICLDNGPRFLLTMTSPLGQKSFKNRREVV